MNNFRDLSEVALMASDGTNAITRLLTAHTKLAELVVEKELNIEEVNRNLEALNDAFVETERKYILTQQQLNSFTADIHNATISQAPSPTEFRGRVGPHGARLADDYEALYTRLLALQSAYRSLEDRERADRERSCITTEDAERMWYDYGPTSENEAPSNDSNTDTSQHTVGNLFGSDE